MAGNEVQKLQLLISISLLSLLLLYYVSHHPSNVRHPTKVFSLIIARAIDKKCMFIVCNGILTFLVRTSSSGTSPPAAHQMETSVDDQPVDDVTVPKIVSEDQEHKEDEFENLVEKETEEMEAAGEANKEMLSVDELNRKVEEFIRKMKEEIRIEAQQQQLIAVY